MEICTTHTNEPIDPLPFYKDKITDNIAPRATRIMIYGDEYKGKVSLDKPMKGVAEINGQIIVNCQ